MTWWNRLLAGLGRGPKDIRIMSLEDQVAAQRQTVGALRYELKRARNQHMADYDNLLDRHEQLQAAHEDLQLKYVALTQPRSADWMLGQGKAVKA